MMKISGMNPAQVRKHAAKISQRLYLNEGSATPSDFVAFKAQKNRESMKAVARRSMTSLNKSSFVGRNNSLRDQYLQSNLNSLG